jgi:hypothetical protein
MYYYGSRREGGRVRTLYYGSGPVAELVECVNRLRALSEIDRRAERREAERALAEFDDRLDRYWRGVKAAFQAAMDEGGFRQHDRGAWRRRRMPTKARKPTAAANAEASPPAPRSFTYDEMVSIAERCQAGDVLALDDFRDVLRSGWRELLLEAIGNPAKKLTDVLISTLAAKDRAYFEAINEKLAELQKDMTPHDAGPLERLLAQAVAVSWLAACVAEWQAARRDRAGGVTPREMEAMARRTDRAHRRFLSAARALSTLRRAAPPQVLVQAVVVHDTPPSQVTRPVTPRKNP